MPPEPRSARAAGGAVVYAKDLERLLAFYTGVASLTLVRREAAFAQLRSGGFELVLHRIPEHIAATFDITEPPQRREDSAIKLVFAVPSLAAARACAAALGGIVDAPDREWSFDGWTICDGHDPEGNVIQLREGR